MDEKEKKYREFYQMLCDAQDRAEQLGMSITLDIRNLRHNADIEWYSKRDENDTKTY